MSARPKQKRTTRCFFFPASSDEYLSCWTYFSFLSFFFSGAPHTSSLASPLYLYHFIPFLFLTSASFQLRRQIFCKKKKHKNKR